jgi:hypothetical protein
MSVSTGQQCMRAVFNRLPGFWQGGGEGMQVQGSGRCAATWQLLNRANPLRWW